uniref:Putative succinate dehydrogenase n=1 Tax=Anopheles braziliensis TaxID=58242 RepID=A0A2M3ZG56_9DIPT
MSNVYRHLSVGGPGTLGPAQEKVHQVGVGVDAIAAPLPIPDDRPLLQEDVAGNWLQFQGSRSAWRNGLRWMQLVYTLVSLVFCRPQYNDFAQWATLFLLCHSFVLSALLLVDHHTRGRCVRRRLPRLDWATIELRYTVIVMLLLYPLSCGLTLSHKGYGSNVWCNWVSFVFTLKTSLLYGVDGWLQLQATYGPE